MNSLNRETRLFRRCAVRVIGYLLMIALLLGVADCNTGSRMRRRLKRNVSSGMKIALIIPDARIYYTSRTSTVPDGHPFDSFVDHGRVKRPQYANFYQQLKLGIEEGFGTSIAMYDPGAFESNFVFKRYMDEIRFHETTDLPHQWLANAKKYDLFIVVKPIEFYDCMADMKSKRKSYYCTTRIQTSLNVFEWNGDSRRSIRKLDYDDNSFISFGAADAFNSFSINADHFREEEALKVAFQARYESVRDEHLAETPQEFYKWGKDFATIVMAEKEESK